MGSEIGRWMLDNNLMEHYSDPMIKDLREAAAANKMLETSPVDTH